MTPSPKKHAGIYLNSFNFPYLNKFRQFSLIPNYLWLIGYVSKRKCERQVWYHIQQFKYCQRFLFIQIFCMKCLSDIAIRIVESQNTWHWEILRLNILGQCYWKHIFSNLWNEPSAFSLFLFYFKCSMYHGLQDLQDHFVTTRMASSLNLSLSSSKPWMIWVFESQ